ncbi:MAG: flippase activity-associated protein Agl23, partial [Anaerolineales bacterium]
MDQKRNWLERPIHSSLPALTNEIAIFAVVILLAFATRFYDLGSRVMSHDESLHTYFSWLLYRGQGYQHSPMMHGPFQFHSIALSYFLFGVSDFTSRIPAALFSIATIWMVWYWRRYLGKWGALIAGLLLVISPYMLYYGRYVRNESYVGFSGILMLYAILRHLEVGGKKYLFMLAAALALHFTSKETSFIYTAQTLIFLAIYFIVQVTRSPWLNAEREYRTFIIALAVAVLLAGGAAGYGLYTRDEATLSGNETAAPSDPSGMTSPLTPPEPASLSLTMIFALAAFSAFIVTAFLLIRGYSWERIRNERSFDLLIVTGTIVLPQLAAFPIKSLENTLKVTLPTTAPEVQALSADLRSILIIAGFLLGMFIISAIIGLLWNKEKWWQTALIFWVPFTILYTTVFTNSDGFFTGTIGSLGYWIVQQDVERGSQPWYYYLLVQIPLYEFLPALGFMLALALGYKRKPAVLVEADDGKDEIIHRFEDQDPEESNFPNTFSLLVWWCVISIFAFSHAGERMPWLTYHIAWPMILLTGWALGRVIDTTDWQKLSEQRFPLALAALPVFIASIAGMALAINGPTPPFQGKELAQLQATAAFLLPLITTVLSAAGIVYFLKEWNFREIRNVFVLIFFAFLALLTTRASFRASYITYDQATEFLVYAHGARGVKDIIEQAKEISERTTGGMGVAIAYDASAPDTGVSWPFVWYLRDFTNQRSFDQPTRSLRDSVVIIVDEKNFDKIEPAIGPGYYRVDYIRMWWPMQDYFGLVYDRDPNTQFPEDYACNGLMSFLKLRKSKDYSKFCEGFTNPDIRAGLVQIWLNRDYTLYAQAKGRSDLTLQTWSPADRMRLYIRQDVASQIWNYGVAPAALETIIDPTEGKYILLPADLIFDSTQANPVVLNGPRSLAFAKDGSVYVADSRNHRILHLDMTGKTIHEWGTFADGVNTPAGPGTFNEPWGVAIGLDGSAYVTDTWNHRVQKFTAQGKFITSWGIFGQGETPQSFYGPRGLAVDAKGRVYVTDTGNKRIVVFDANGNFITQFGSAGFDAGQFDEPVGIAVDRNGTVYVVDTW